MNKIKWFKNRKIVAEFSVDLYLHGRASTNYLFIYSQLLRTANNEREKNNKQINNPIKHKSCPVDQLFSDLLQFVRVVHDHLNPQVHLGLLQREVKAGNLGVLDFAGHSLKRI